VSTSGVDGQLVIWNVEQGGINGGMRNLQI